MRRRTILLLAITVAVAAGCGKKDNHSGNVVTPGNNTPTNNAGGDAGSDMGAADAGDMGTTTPGDMGTTNPGDTGSSDFGINYDVSMPGYMNGTWILTAAGDTTTIATLKLRHVEGETNVDGTFDMANPSAFGRIVGGKYQMMTFTTSWTINDNGSNRRFGLADCYELQTPNQMSCRFSDSKTATIIDSDLTKQ